VLGDSTRCCDQCKFDRSTCRVCLNRSTALFTQAALDAGEPLLVELCRNLVQTADAAPLPLSDPAFAAYHALFEVEGVEQLAEPGSTAAVQLVARPLGAFAAAAGQWGVGASCLPAAYTPPPT